MFLPSFYSRHFDITAEPHYGQWSIHNFHRYFAEPHYFLECMPAQAYYLSIMNSLTIAEKARVAMALVEGDSVRSTSRMTGHSKGAILKLLAELGTACASTMTSMFAMSASVVYRQMRFGVFWGAKAKNTKLEKKAEGWGDTWTWTWTWVGLGWMPTQQSVSTQENDL